MDAFIRGIIPGIALRGHHTPPMEMSIMQYDFNITYDEINTP
jgi:hypothetical protein